ncbi:MAG: hypothetical protein OES57_16555, partial [Acidimicrobiia bacterium]|nr:hypothetical protein [Acidimicrobiia bacterium]
AGDLAADAGTGAGDQGPLAREVDGDGHRELSGFASPLGGVSRSSADEELRRLPFRCTSGRLTG